MRKDRKKLFIALDFDRTLAEFGGHYVPGELGAPIPKMIQNVNRWMEEGHTIVIFTTRVWAGRENEHLSDAILNRQLIQEWCFKHLGFIPRVTAEKELFDYIVDDIAVGCVPNTGVLLGEVR